MRRTPPASPALDEVRAVYADVDARPIERHCTLQTGCCHFQLTGATPKLTRGEAVLAAGAVRAAGRTKLPERPDGACPLLHPRTARCIIYQDRPFGCRTHFCEAAGGPYARREVIDLIRRLEDVDRQLGGVGPQSLVPAVAGALRDMA